MSRIFITGSADGLGQMAANLLIKAGHQVVLHARNADRARQALADAPGAETVVTGDMANIKETIALANQVNNLGKFDAIIHNAAVGYTEPRRLTTVDGLAHVFAVNSLAPYILTALIEKPQRLIYLSSRLHQDGDPSLRDLNWEERAWSGFKAYSDSKLHNVLLAFAVARKWPAVYANALEPGWVPTKMGGPGAPDSLEDAPKTQVWLASSNDQQALVSGKYFYHLKQYPYLPAAAYINIQEKFLEACSQLSGIDFPV